MVFSPATIHTYIVDGKTMAFLLLNSFHMDDTNFKSINIRSQQHWMLGGHLGVENMLNTNYLAKAIKWKILNPKSKELEDMGIILASRWGQKKVKKSLHPKLIQCSGLCEIKVGINIMIELIRRHETTYHYILK